METTDIANQVVGSKVESLMQVGVVHNLWVDTSRQPADAPTNPWAELVRQSSIWDHVRESRETALFRERAERVAARLGDLAAAAMEEVASDPWQDPDMAARFLHRIEWLLGEAGYDPPPDLYAAEATLLVLMPLLYRTHHLVLAAGHSAVRPDTLTGTLEPSASRRSFEAFIAEFPVLVKRAQLRPDAARPIGWWLFHQWLLRDGRFADVSNVRGLLSEVDLTAVDVDELLTVERVTGLLHGLRRGPDVCNPEFLAGFRPEEGIPSSALQRVRGRSLVLLLALAYNMTIETIALPGIVPDHLGIPHAVDPDQLRHTLERAGWTGTRELPVLRARCRHEAVIEGLHEYTKRLDGLLHAVVRTVSEQVMPAVPRLPSRFSAEEVTPDDGAFNSWASFRLDEHRVRDLLMGVQLYKDRNLAVRELYQNALDACRYRRARTEFLDRTEPADYSYSGRIDFVQGVDSAGRHYLDCIDNGVGMGEAELRGVFSNAGARFAENWDFKLERASWAELEPPVELHPNSRFGIGVLSYFMLADEITVTTCRMTRSGHPGPVLEAHIFGPGHLFRIVTTEERGSNPGTTIRLYLREEMTQEAWSSVQALRQVLGVAEFATAAKHGEHTAYWAPGRLTPRPRPTGETFGVHAEGAVIPWRSAPKGVQVFWGQRGGGLLVDGLAVLPGVRTGIVATQGPGLTGVVVNLFGLNAPQHLTADRSHVLDELSGRLRGWLTEATAALVAEKSVLPQFDWICRIAEDSVSLADLLTEAIVNAGTTLTYAGRELDMARTGCLPADTEIMETFAKFGYDSDRYQSRAPVGSVPDHIFLWRLLAHGPNDMLAALTELIPELEDVRPVLPARPSDVLLLTRPSQGVPVLGRHGRIRAAVRNAGSGPGGSQADGLAGRQRHQPHGRARSGPPPVRPRDLLDHRPPGARPAARWTGARPAASG